MENELIQKIKETSAFEIYGIVQEAEKFILNKKEKDDYTSDELILFGVCLILLNHSGIEYTQSDYNNKIKKIQKEIISKLDEAKEKLFEYLNI